MNLPLPPLHPAHSLSKLVEVIHFLHAQGWTPATSSNFSQRRPEDAAHFDISISGLNKGQMTPQDFVTVNAAGQPVVPREQPIQPSAETLLHSLIYRLFPEVNTVLHCHSVNGTVLSKLYEAEHGLWLREFEILKGLQGITTHQTNVWLPVYPNAQNMAQLAADIERNLLAHPPVYGFMLAGHGLYTWGQTPAQAQRHVEVFEFLFDAILKLRAYGYADYS